MIDVVAAEKDDATVAETPSASKRRAITEPPPERYQLLGQIGEGGMGRVYRARDTTLGRDVAIKLIESSELHGPDRTIQRERFVREARAAARLLHPNIAVVHDVDPEAGWLVMELVEGESLRDRAERGRLEPARCPYRRAQQARALELAPFPKPCVGDVELTIWEREHRNSARTLSPDAWEREEKERERV